MQHLINQCSETPFGDFDEMAALLHDIRNRVQNNLNDGIVFLLDSSGTSKGIYQLQATLAQMIGQSLHTGWGDCSYAMVAYDNA